jgi:hypothetical protein
MKPSLGCGNRQAGALAQVALLALLGLTVLTACVMVPVTREVYDPECQSMRRQIVLAPAVMGQFNACGGRDCSALLVAMGAVTAASVVVSGSIAVVGNVAYWAEHKASCKRNDAASAAPSAPLFSPPSSPGPAATEPGAQPGPAAPQAPVPPTVPASSTSRAPAPP